MKRFDGNNNNIKTDDMNIKHGWIPHTCFKCKSTARPSRVRSCPPLVRPPKSLLLPVNHEFGSGMANTVQFGKWSGQFATGVRLARVCCRLNLARTH